MIQANELRIGNWVKHYLEHYNLDPSLYMTGFVRVTDLTHGEYFHWECDSWPEELGFGKIISGQKYADTEPIHLTAEILLACEFIKACRTKANSDYFHDKNNCIKIWEDEKGFYVHSINDEWCVYLKSLHQLQNLYFALTGTELVFSDVLKMVK